MNRADVDSLAKLAHTFSPVLVRNCSAARYMDQDTWHDNTDQLKNCEAKAELSIGDCKPTDKMPEGTTVPYVEEQVACCGSLGRTSGTYRMIVDHADDATIDTTYSCDSKEAFCGVADLVVAALVPVEKAFQGAVSGGRFWQGSGRTDVWTSQS